MGKYVVASQAVCSRLLDNDSFIYSGHYASKFKIYHDSKEDRIDIQNNIFINTFRDKVQSNSYTKYNRAYNLAKNQDRYIFGLPTASNVLRHKSTVEQAVLNYIKKENPSVKRLEYFYMGDKLFAHYAHQRLVDEFGYKSSTNTLTIKDTSYSLVSAKILLTTQSKQIALDTLDDYQGIGFNADSIIYGESTQQDELEVIYRENQDSETKILKIDLSDLIPNQEEGTKIAVDDNYTIIQACYILDGNRQYFSYALGSQEIYELETALQLEEARGEYYPRLYLKLNQRNITQHDKTTKEHSEALAKRLGLKLKDVQEQIIKGLGDNADKTHTIYIAPMVGVKEALEDEQIAEYFYKYFSNLVSDKRGTYVTQQIKAIKGNYAEVRRNNIFYGSLVMNTSTKDNKDVRDSAISIREFGGFTHHVQDNRVSCSIHFDNLMVCRVKGVLDNNKTYECTSGIHFKNLSPFVSMTSSSTDGSYLTFKHQIKPDEYIQVVVFNLGITHQFEGRSESVWGTDENCRIPLDRSILRDMSLREKETLMHKSLCVQILVYVRQKKKWYQRGWFKVVVAVVGIAITVFSVGTDGGSGAAMALAVLKGIAISVAVDFAIKLAVKVLIKLGVSEKVAAIIATVAYIATVIFSRGQGFKGLNAKDVLKALGVGANFYSKGVEMKMNELKKNHQEFMQNINDKYKRLKELQKTVDLQDTKPNIELLSRVHHIHRRTDELNLGETVEEFYNRMMLYDVSNLTTTMAENFIDMSMHIPIRHLQYRDGLELEEELLII